MSDQDSQQQSGLAQLFMQADSAIERRRTENIFKQLDERSLTEEEERIIQQRVELQRRLLQEYEKREHKRKVAELQDLWPDLSEAAASRALELCQGKEDDAVLRLTEEPAFRRRVTAEVAAHTPVTVLSSKGAAAARSSSNSSSRLRPDRHGPSTARLISPSKLDGSVFVGRFRSKLGPYQEQALADAAAARAGSSAAAAAPGQPQHKKRGRPKKRKDPPADAAAAAAADVGHLCRAAALGAARAAGACSQASKRRCCSPAPDPAACMVAAAAAAASGTEPSAAAAADAIASDLSMGTGQTYGDTAMRERSSSPSSNEPEAASEAEADYPQEDSSAAAALAAYASACDDVGAGQDAEAVGQAVGATDFEGLAAAAADVGPVPTPATTATNTGYGTDTDGPEEPQQQQQQQQQCASVADSGAAAERVTSMMARQVARLEPLLAAGRLLDFELRRPGAAQAVLALLGAEYGQQVCVPIGTAWEVLLEEHKWQEAEEAAADEAAAAAGRGARAAVSSNSKTALAAAAAAVDAARQTAAGEGSEAGQLQQQALQQQQVQQQQQQPDIMQPVLLEPLQQLQHPQQPAVLDPVQIAAALAAAAAALTAEAAAASNTPSPAADSAANVAAPLDLAAPAASTPAAAAPAAPPAAVDPAAAAAAPVSPSFLQQYTRRMQPAQQEAQLAHADLPLQQPTAMQQHAPFSNSQQQLQQQQRQQQQQALQTVTPAVETGCGSRGGACAGSSAAAAAVDSAGEASDASTTTEPSASPVKAQPVSAQEAAATAAAAAAFGDDAALREQHQQTAELPQLPQLPQRRSSRAAAVAAVSAATAVAAAGEGRQGSSSASLRGGGSGSSRASRAISDTGHTCRGRVRQKSHKTTELVEVGELMAHPDWYNAGYIFPAGFKSRLLFRSSVDLDALTLHECEIVGQGGACWPAPTFVVTARDREDEPIVAKSCTGCWSGILKRINAVIARRIAEGEALPPPPRTAIAGPEYFGLNDAATIAAIEALDPQHLCTTYWLGKQQREAAAAGMPVAVQPLPRGSSSRAGRGGGSSGAGGGRKRGRGRADAAAADDEGDDALGYKGSHWSSISRRERYIKRCTEAGQEAPLGEEAQLLPGLLDPVTLEPVVNPAISPAGHVMGLATWKAVLAESGRCPFTKASLRADMLTVLTANNIDKYRGRIVAMT